MDVMSRKGSAILVVLVVVGILIIVGGIFVLKNISAPIPSLTATQTPSGNATTSNATPTTATATLGDPLALVPVILNLPIASASTSQQFSYYGVTFDVPWKETPQVVTSKDGSATQLKFPGGQFITILKSSSYVNTVPSASTPGFDLAKAKSVYGQDIFSSDYNFLLGALDITPSSTGIGQAILIAVKYPFFGFLDKNSTALAIYDFSLPTLRGIQLVGQDQTTNQIYRINFLFNSQGVGAHDFVIGGATNDEANAILASLQMK